MAVSRRPARLRLLLALTALAAVLAPAASQAAGGPRALFTQTNDPAGNAVQAFDRGTDGRLTPAGTFPTGGAGLATLGGHQGAVEASDDGAYVYAVNAGSDTVTVFRSAKAGLSIVDPVPPGGSAPTSVDRQAGRVYVLNSGGTANVTGFNVRPDGSLAPIAGGSRDLPGAL